MFDGQEFFGVRLVLRSRTVLSPNGVEHLLPQVAKLVPDDVPPELTQRCLDAENPTYPSFSHIGKTPHSSAA
jgi:hypothetical protein